MLIASATGSFIFALSDAVFMSLISSAATVILGIVATYFAYRAKIYSERAEKMSEQTHKAVNSRMDEMLALAKKSSKAEGVAESAAKVKAELKKKP